MMVLGFEIADVEPSRLAPFEVDGFEAISTLYRFEIACDLSDGRLLDEDLAGRRATLRIGTTEATAREVKGLIESFDIMTPTVEGHPVVYKFKLVPTLSLLQRARYSQIYGTEEALSVDDILKSALNGDLQRDSRLHPPSDETFASKVNLKSTYPKLDHVVQYEETNLNFISRIAEHYGIFYFFENDDDRDSVVFIDDNILAPTLSGGQTLSWKAWTIGVEDAFPDVVQGFDAHCEAVPSRVFLTDYNYRLPHVPLLVDAEVDPKGIGNWSEHGAYYFTPDEGQFLVQLRAEELRSRKMRFEGRSQTPRLSAGYVFSLTDHPFKAWNKKYLTLSVRHHARLPRPGLDEGSAQVAMGYWNEFAAVPADEQFRPERRTPRPRMDGLLNGRVEGDGSTDRPMLDDQGRYRVRIPFDLSNSPEGKGSRWVRLASPFGGDGDGMHFPLFPGTEVVLGCVNGDPDRPMILGAVQNQRNKNVVTGDNPLVNRIVYRSGMGLEAFGGAIAPPVVAGAGAGGPAGDGALQTQNAFSGPTAATQAPLMQQDALDEPANLTGDGTNSLRLWSYSAGSAGAALTGGPPANVQWLRLGTAASYTPSDGSAAIPEGNDSATGFDLATGGVGRVWAANNLYLMRDGGVGAASSSGNPNRLIGIDDKQVLIAHDQAIIIGEASGSPGHPPSITLNADAVTTNAASSAVSYVGADGQLAITHGDVSAMTLGDNNTMNIGLTTGLYAGGYVAIYVGALVLNVNAGALFNVTVGAGIALSFSAMLNIGTANTFEIAAGGIVKVKSTDTLISEAKTEITAATSLQLAPLANKIVNIETNVTDIKQDIGQINNKVSDVETSIFETSIDLLLLKLTL